MTKALPRAVIFDWDNTLVDSWGAIAEAINYARARYGLTTWNRDEIMANCTRSAREAFPDWFGDKWQEAWVEYYDYFAKVRQRMGINKANGATELLEWLQSKEIPAVVVSNKSGEQLRIEAVHLEWNKYFAALVGAHDAPYDKPAREHADHALMQVGMEGGSDIWFIGDSITDIACARNAKCKPILIGTREDAEELGVDMFFRDCAAVLEKLKEIAS
ncbi:MAG: HAD family hydrolase [Alphaproteobacteria bacterium]|nr:HAD family hydrolase [Alphaproteobacteria bacterium]